MNVILHVEDDLGHALLVRRALEGLPFVCDIRHVADGQSALNYLQRQNNFSDPSTSPRPLFVLLDLNLPKLKGLDVLKEIKTDVVLRDIPVIILTTSDSAEDIRLSHENHADKYITKPGSYRELVDELRDLVKDLLLKPAS